MDTIPRPTDFELAVLQVLWKQGDSTVRQVYEALGSKGAYTTVLTIMKIMTEKGLIKPDKSRTSYVYSVTMPPEVVKRRLVSDLVDRAFAGAAQELVLQALSSTSASKEDLKAIRKLIGKLEKEHEQSHSYRIGT
ncbi:MAG: BlaI/MecI/CopY family transcriptional regulator [Methylacidiphilales bacterium]|nr:BlaI/MecI/CopY family transcriptional regulator [Candidatus Methylacidiphilales bacterium]